MSGPYALREFARSDLEAIWVYTAEQWGVEQAERYLQGLVACFEELAANPRLGRQRDDVKAGYRGFPQRRHVVFYVIASAGIEMIGIVHQSADVDTQLGGPPKHESGDPDNQRSESTLCEARRSNTDSSHDGAKGSVISGA